MKKHAPVFIPSLAFAAGSWVAFQLSPPSLPWLAVLAVLGCALRRSAGFLLAAFSLGVMVAAVRHPLNPLAGLDLERPVEAVVKVTGHWIADALDSPEDDPGWSAPGEVLRLRQDTQVAEPELEVMLHLPGAEEPPAFGSSLRLKAYLGRSPGFANRVPTPPGPWRMRVKSRSLMEIEAPPGRVAGLSSALRRRVEKAYRAASPDGPGKALARALVLGDASAIPLEWKRGLRITGLYHLLSVS
ncbi:MAG TPA: hypothetical protein VE078_08985, partial [Thermoanaerobaculia bacterium]|nr:hypothetical protein [Thermoanaerobaculia bacterium]